VRGRGPSRLSPENKQFQEQILRPSKGNLQKANADINRFGIGQEAG
jgi:hypothetical protein